MAADIYSFGIIMCEFLSEEIPFNDIPHNEFLAIEIVGLSPIYILKDIPKLLADLIIKYGEGGEDDENGDNSQNSEIYFQIEECDKIREEKFKNMSNEDKSTSNLYYYTAQLTSANPISECLDVQLSELELNEICQDDEHNIE
ncbi:hypothetical protein C1646_774462 [Rhizophagus diaphanus]|nr:hypothetical protein C1646_774462 [Rhizophagus diaphanus] [Rhizophagus sp. MUCL 43196]